MLYVHGLSDPVAERRLLDMAPAVLFLHTYIGTCISGGKTWTRPTPVPCSRRFGWPCLLHYFPHGCGGHNPITMWRQYLLQSDRLEQLRRYRAIVTHTDHMRREMANHGLAVQVIPFPVEAQATQGTRPADGNWRLLFAGRMERLKGGHVLIDAMPAAMAGVDRHIGVVMAGDGGERGRLEARARDVAQATRGLTFEFPGWLTQDEVGTLMKAGDLLVVPSLWPEPLGAVGPAAAQHGMPAAAFAVGGISQWLIEGVSGHLAPADPPTPAGLARAIVQCLHDPSHHAALRQGARQTADSFTMARHMPPLLTALARAATD